MKRIFSPRSSSQRYPVTWRALSIRLYLPEGYGVPQDVLIGVVHWLHKGCVTGARNPFVELDWIRRQAAFGAMYCSDEGCEAGAYTRTRFGSTFCETLWVLSGFYGFGISVLKTAQVEPMSGRVEAPGASLLDS